MFLPKKKNIGNPTIMMMIFSEEQKKATKLMWLWSTASKEGMTITSHISYDMKYLYDVLSKKYGVPYYNFYILSLIHI